MEIAFVSIVLLAVAFTVLFYPMYIARPRARLVSVSTLDDLLAQRDGVYATLRDIEMDRQLGKLDENDYAALRSKYMARAAELLKAIDSLRGTGETAAASEQLEAEIAALRKTRALNNRSAVQSSPRDGDGEPAGYCRHCGRPHQREDKFCTACGESLN